VSEHDLGQSSANILWLDQPGEASSETATISYEAIALTEAALALLQRAEEDGGRLEVAEIVPAAHDALAACLEHDWLQRHQDRTRAPPGWHTIPQAGQVLVGDPILRKIVHLERLLRDYRECHDPINRTHESCSNLRLRRDHCGTLAIRSHSGEYEIGRSHRSSRA
jgi:hypothetical protein